MQWYRMVSYFYVSDMETLYSSGSQPGRPTAPGKAKSDFVGGGLRLAEKPLSKRKSL